MILYKLIFCFVLLAAGAACSRIADFVTDRGTLLIIRVEPNAGNLTETFEQAKTILESRLNALSVRGKITKQSSDAQSNQLAVKIYGSVDTKRIKKVLLSESNFEIRPVVSKPSPFPLQIYPTKNAADSAAVSNQEVFPMLENKSSPAVFLIVEKNPVITGEDVRDASAVSSSGFNDSYEIGFSLKPEGAQKLKTWTSAHLNNYLAIMLNGQVYSAPVVRGEISDSGIISGAFTKEEAEDLALIMKSGYLPAFLILEEESVFGD